jgi:hypothetical protein
MTLPITVITPSLPERASERGHAIASVIGQTLTPADHLLLIDHRREGGSRPLSALAAAVQTEWTAILTDDDSYLPDYLENLWPLCEGADVVYSPPILLGSSPWEGYNEPFDAGTLRVKSIVSHVALVRTELIARAGYWQQESGYDWRFWVRCLDLGARFARHDRQNWIYDLGDHVRHESRP